MLAAGLAGNLANFRVDLDKLPPTADFVASVIRENYPALKVPLHARWRHFVFGGRDLWADIAAKTSWRDVAARARAEFDLAIVSVLLDAGAGPDWRYQDAATELTIGRSEGLALASLRMFEAGVFSADTRDPLRADATRLATLTAGELARGFAVTGTNPLTGLEGRAALLARLGRVLLDNETIFARRDGARPGGLFDHLAAAGKTLAAPAVLHELLLHLGAIWPDRLMLGGLPLGDTWRHPAIKRGDASNGLVPLHKLSQWLTYSLIEPLQRAGLTVTDIDGLTGLAEYRNGGLFVDAGVIALRDPNAAHQPHAVDSTLVVEWRALTVALLDRLAPLVRERLGVTKDVFPLGALLEGGTLGRGTQNRQRETRGRRSAARGSSATARCFEVCHEGRHHRRSSFGAAQADAAARQDALDQGLPRAVRRDRGAALLRGDARPGAGKGRSKTPFATMMAPVLAGKKLVLAPVGRAGSGFLDGILKLVPSARVAHVGLYRDPRTLVAVEYFFKARTTWPNASRWCCTRCSPPEIRRSPPSTGSRKPAPRVCASSACWRRRNRSKNCTDSTLKCRSTRRRSTTASPMTATSCPGLGDVGDRMYGTR